MSKVHTGKLDNNQEPICPNCKAVVDAFTSVGDSPKPKNGDASICLYCCAVNQFVLKDGIITLTEASEDVIEYVNSLNLPSYVRSGKNGVMH